ncbi:hypothetical protein KBD20_03435 [Candidatus Saccharibacteria bacterium]|nr:hypothetical protein [Candidatus Saccharibacteria bacterium]
MTLPNREPKTTCKPCELRNVDFTDWMNGIDVPTVAKYMTQQVIENGEDIRRAPTMAYDPDSGFEVPCHAAAATRDCVARIIAGDCLKYTIGKNGKIGDRKTKKKAKNK